nr:putative serine carboxypeptidase-like 30 [Quercus suber]
MDFALKVTILHTLALLLLLLSIIMEPVVCFRHWKWTSSSSGKKITSEGNGDLVTGLPGQPNVNFKHYAGYVSVNEKKGRALFYWFYEATTQADERPLVLWLNGGPGCSSVGYGATQEIGPFLVDTHGNGLEYNPYSWNTKANILFLESPVGVGFSYSNTTSDYINLGDEFTVQLGNPETSDAEDWRGLVDYAWSHAVISDETHKIIKSSCDFNVNDTWSNNDCSEAIDEVLKQYREIDIYSLYTSVCTGNSADSDNKSMQVMMKRTSKMMPRIMGGYDPCLDEYAKTFYNRPDVQKALHVSDGHQLKNWSICNMNIFDKWSDSKPSVLPIYKKLITAGLRIWVYSGDTDGRVPVLSTRYSLSALGLLITKAWRPWYHQKEVSGWFQEYEGLTFATFRGAGHAVPCFKPSDSLAFFSAFLQGESPPAAR